MEVAGLKMVRWALGVTKKDQIKKRILERDRDNRKARRQTAKCKATLVWTRKKERRRLRGKKMIKNAGARQKKKRKAKEKVDRFGKRRHGKSWSYKERQS